MRALREELMERLENIQARAARLGVHKRSLLPADGEEQAAAIESDEVVEHLDEAVRAEAEALRAALVRMDAGTFGVCASCGGTIPEGRLRAMPFAATCVRCAA